MGTQWVVSKFALVSWRDGRIEITSATSGATLVSGDIELLRIVHAFAVPSTIEDAVQEFPASPSDHLRASVDTLIRAGILTPAAEREAAARHHWDWSALAYHRRSRRPGFRKLPDRHAPAAITHPAETWIPLKRGSEEGGPDLALILAKRRSYRAWPDGPISFDTFSRFLWLSARNRESSSATSQDEHVSRPYPSGGAAYSLELYAVLARHAVETIPTGVYRYVPDRHGLETVTSEPSDARPFLEAAGRSAGTSPPPIVVLITSRIAEQSATYGELAYGLVLKEVGGLFQTLYLVGEYLGLGPCALGGGAPAGRLARLRHTTELAEPVVGEFMLGPRRAAEHLSGGRLPGAI